jgi:hypothetical protein
MPRSYASTVIDAPADRVWATVRDFNTLPVWFPSGITDSQIEDGKRGDQVGAIRSFHLADGAHFREQLLAHSDLERSYTYDFQQTTFDVDNYLSTLRVTPVTHGDRSFVEWWVTFDCDRDRQDYWVEFFATQVFGGGLASLTKHLAGA